MQLQNTMFIWQKNNTTFLRAIPYGTVDLGLFTESFAIDGAIHPKFRTLCDEKASEYLVSIITMLLKKGFKSKTIYYNLLGIHGLNKALKIAEANVSPIIKLQEIRT